MNRTQRATASLLAMAAGWAAGYAAYVVFMTCCTDWHKPTDQEAMLGWSAIFVFVSWLLVALPLALIVAARSPVFSPRFAPLLGGCIGVIAFAVLLSWSPLWREPMFLGYAAVVGAAAALTYSVLIRLPRRNPQPSNSA